jgi:hypothetical protein
MQGKPLSDVRARTPRTLAFSGHPDDPPSFFVHRKPPQQHSLDDRNSSVVFVGYTSRHPSLITDGHAPSEVTVTVGTQPPVIVVGHVRDTSTLTIDRSTFLIVPTCLGDRNTSRHTVVGV